MTISETKFRQGASHGLGVRHRLTRDLHDLAPAQRKLAAYLLENIATASDFTITDLADESGVSIGTISALCRRLELRGYQDLRLGLARDAVMFGGVADVAQGAGPSENGAPNQIDDSIWKVFSAGAEALAATAQQLDPQLLERALSMIDEASHVEWVGVGTAGLVAAEGALKFRKLGLNTVSHSDNHQQLMSASVLGPTDLLIVVSHSGRTIDVIECARLAKEGGAGIVALTGLGRSPLAQLADVVIGTVSTDTAFQVEPMASTLAQLAVIQLLFLSALRRGGPEAEERLARTQAALEDRHLKGLFR